MVFKLAILHRLIHYLTDSFSVFLECTEKKPKIDFKSKSFSENGALSDNPFYSGLLESLSDNLELCSLFAALCRATSHLAGSLWYIR